MFPAAGTACAALGGGGHRHSARGDSLAAGSESVRPGLERLLRVGPLPAVRLAVGPVGAHMVVPTGPPGSLMPCVFLCAPLGSADAASWGAGAGAHAGRPSQPPRAHICLLLPWGRLARGAGSCAG